VFAAAPRQPGHHLSEPQPQGSRDKRDEDIARQLQRQFDDEVKHKVSRASFDCPICLATSAFDESVQLDCSHRFCKDCFRSHLDILINEKRTRDEDLRCPMHAVNGCQMKITVPQVQGAMKSTPSWDRFLATRSQRWRPRSGDAERLCECPLPRCGAAFLMPKDGSLVSLARSLIQGNPDEVQCPACGGRFCSRCQAEHAGINCEDFQTRKRQAAQQNSAEREFEELKMQEGWQDCPKCKAVCERAQGCNYMTCQSERCHGRTKFCYVCGMELSILDHVTHFPSGPFQNVCKMRDRRNDICLRQASILSSDGQGDLATVATDILTWMRG